MKRILYAAMIASAVAAGSVVPVTAPQAARVSFGFNAGNVAFGYTDGFWDRGHVWHPWPSTGVRNRWRAGNRAHFFPHPHTRFRGGGWRTPYW